MTRRKRSHTAEEGKIIDLLWANKSTTRLIAGYVTVVEPIPIGSNDDKGPWGGNPKRMAQPGETLKIVMMSRMGDFGLTDQLDRDTGYDVRLDWDDAAISNIRLTP